MNYTYIPDLAERIAELTKQGHPTEHVQGRALYTDDHVKLLAFPFEAGQALEEHTAPHPAMLHFLEGEADVTLGGEAVEARAGTWIHMAPDLPHSIRARTPVLMLLLILRAVP
ncbi:MAG TPA: cupin domain-containing protein [Rubricoccaceae bacterium]|nr:cupin domain-containing protein [Rubricoccaceae bacterium]